MTRLWILAGICLLLSSASGCGTMSRPNWFHPGSSEAQHARAQQFDPYPEDNIGPSNVSMRPPGFESSYPETQRARPWEKRSTFSQ